ncbi:MAG: hypothetical protein ACFB5Z_02060 [Elainellaceae cyanobacterium]
MASITVTTAANSGAGSLREAIASASSGDTIVFSSQLANKTIRLDEQLVVSKSLTFDGAAAPNLTLSGQNKTRIMHVDYNFSDVVIRNLAFANGRAADNDPNNKPQQGGAIKLGDPNTLVVENSRFINNAAERGGAINVGYGASATIVNSVFDGNDGTLADNGFSAGAISTAGGGKGAKVVNRRGDREVGGEAFLDIRNSTFTNNKGSYGAVYTLLSGLRVEDTVFRNNEGTRGAGAIFTDGANGTAQDDNLGGTTIVRNVVAENNKSGEHGGAFYFYGYSGDKYIVENAQIAGNSAFRGGGIGAQSGRDKDNGVELIIRNSVIADNTASSQGGGLWTDVKDGVTIEDSTFSGNQVTTPTGGGDIGGAIVLNTREEAKSTITNTTFVDNYAGRQSGNIWIGGREKAKNLTITDSRFANNRAGSRDTENTVNFEVKEGGGNLVQSKTGVDTGLPKAKLVETLKLDPIPTAGGSNSGAGDPPAPTTGTPTTGASTGEDAAPPKSMPEPTDDKPQDPIGESSMAGGDRPVKTGSGDDTVVIGAEDSTVNAKSGDDFVYSEGNISGSVHTVDLGAGEDSFWATSGDNAIAGKDDNTIGIGKGDDTVSTYGGDDFVYSVGGGGGDNTLSLGGGDNTVWVEGGSYKITAGAGDDAIGLGVGVDSVNAGSGDNVIYTIDAASAGNKDIMTGAGNDYIQTGAGDDRLDGGLGDINTLAGGEGADTFVLRQGTYTYVEDFEAGRDAIALSGTGLSEISISQGTGEAAQDAFISVDGAMVMQVADTQATALDGGRSFIGA